MIKRAGFTVWPILFVNIRSTRETELLKAGYPIHIVTAWMGNTPTVALKHYAQVTDEDFLAASGMVSPLPAPAFASFTSRASEKPSPTVEATPETDGEIYSRFLKQSIQLCDSSLALQDSLRGNNEELRGNCGEIPTAEDILEMLREMDVTYDKIRGYEEKQETKKGSENASLYPVKGCCGVFYTLDFAG